MSHRCSRRGKQKRTHLSSVLENFSRVRGGRKLKETRSESVLLKAALAPNPTGSEGSSATLHDAQLRRGFTVTPRCTSKDISLQRPLYKVLYAVGCQYFFLGQKESDSERKLSGPIHVTYALVGFHALACCVVVPPSCFVFILLHNAPCCVHPRRAQFWSDISLKAYLLHRRKVLASHRFAVTTIQSI